MALARAYDQVGLIHLACAHTGFAPARRKVA
jgi:hypothetical protein